jgi:hypothetical protein
MFYAWISMDAVLKPPFCSQLFLGHRMQKLILRPFQSCPELRESVLEHRGLVNVFHVHV